MGTGTGTTAAERAPGAAPAPAAAGESGDEDDMRAPWHFKLMMVLLAAYLGNARSRGYETCHIWAVSGDRSVRVAQRAMRVMPCDATRRETSELTLASPHLIPSLPCSSLFLPPQCPPLRGDGYIFHCHPPSVGRNERRATLSIT